MWMIAILIWKGRTLIKIIIELWPLGFEKIKKEIASAKIVNDTTGTKTRGK